MVDPRLRARVDAYYRAFNARDEPAYLACFHPEGAVGGTLTGIPIAGVGVQKAILRTASGSMGDLTMSAVHLYQAQEEVAVEWAGDVRALDGTRTPVAGITLFAFDEDQRIRLCRVYWDPYPLAGQGVPGGGAVDLAHRTAIEAYFLGFNARDWDRIVSLFQKSGTFGGTLAGPDLKGVATLGSIYEAAVTRFPGIRMHPTRAFQSQNEVAVRWDGEARGWDGRVQAIQGVSIFGFDGQGRIARYRIYWDPRRLLPEA